MSDTSLTQQHMRLDSVAAKYPHAVVVGWDHRAHGPLIRFTNGRVRAVNPDGRFVVRAGEKVAA